MPTPMSFTRIADKRLFSSADRESRVESREQMIRREDPVVESKINQELMLGTL